MMKFLRKHMKQMLAVFLALLLISWLGGSALQMYLSPKPGQHVLGYAYGEKIHQYELTQAANEGSLLDWLRLPWRQPWLMMPGGRSVMLGGLDPIDWMLLREEAKREKMVVTEAEVEDFLRLVDRQGIVRQRLQENMHMSLAGINQVVAHYLQVVRLGEIVGTSAKVSEAELQRAIADRQERVEIRMVCLDGKAFEDAEAEVDASDLAKQFEAYRDQAAGTGKYGFGYLFPKRVRIQSMGVDVEALTGLVRVTDRQAREYWRANKESEIFERPKASSQPTTGSAPASKPASTQSTKPAEEEKPEYFTTFTEAKEAALRHLREEKAQQEGPRLLNDILSQLSVDFSTLEVGKDGYRIAPEAVKRPGYYASVYERFQKMQYGKALRLYEPDTLMTQEELSGLKGIGETAMGAGGRRPPVPFTQLAMQVQGLTEIPKGEGVNRSHYLSLYQTCVSPLWGEDGNCYIFRVVESQAPRPPAQLAEVADAVKKDVLRLRAYEAAGRIAERLAKEAKEADLEKAWSDEADLKKKVGADYGFQNPSPFSRVGPGSSVPGIGVNETFTEACFALAASKPASQGEKIIVVELPKEKKWAVVEYVKTIPMRKDQYAMLKSFLWQRLEMQKQGEVLGEWFRSENIRKRADFSFAKETEEDSEGEG